MKNLMKVLSVVITVALVLAMMMVPLYADVDGPKDLLSGTPENSRITETIGEVGAGAKNIATTVGMVISIIILAVFGIQWFMGGANQKAALQDKIWSYLIGAVLCFAGPTIFFAVAEGIESFLK